MSKLLLQTQNLGRKFGEFQALKPVNLTLHEGEMVALVGPNGSGKTTLLLCLSGLLRQTSGEVQVEGFDLYQDERQVRKHLAFVPDVPVFYQELTAWEHLRFLAMAHNDLSQFESRAEELLREFGLWEARDLFPQVYSRGMRLKLGVVLALIRPFSVLLMDEPNSALDTESIEVLTERLRVLSLSGKGILLSTHDPNFARQLNAKAWNIRDGILTME